MVNILIFVKKELKVMFSEVKNFIDQDKIDFFEENNKK